MFSFKNYAILKIWSFHNFWWELLFGWISGPVEGPTMWFYIRLDLIHPMLSTGSRLSTFFMYNFH